MNDNIIITEALNTFPGAVSEVEAVDLLAQKTFLQLKEIDQKDKDFCLLRSKYFYLKTLRNSLHQNRVASLSSFLINSRN